MIITHWLHDLFFSVGIQHRLVIWDKKNGMNRGYIRCLTGCRCCRCCCCCGRRRRRCCWRRVDIWPFCFLHFSAFSRVVWGGMLTFLELAHATHAMVLHAHALHATPMLMFLELAHATHAMVLRAHALHATPMLTFLELAHATHAMVLRAQSMFLELAHATHAMVLRAHALHATHATPASSDKFIPPELSNKSGKGGAVNEKIFTYLYAWVWNYHLPTKANFKKELAKIC